MKIASTSFSRPIKIIHTADVHLGKRHSRSGYSDRIRARLTQERMDSLARVVGAGNDAKADFLVIAGDLFDRTQIPVALIKETIETLAPFEGHVLVLPGNHDYYEPESELWRAFERHAEGRGNIEVLTECRTYSFDVADAQMHVYAAPCHSRTSDSHAIGWIGLTQERCEKSLNLGIAHGNVEGLSLDKEGRYFTMTEAELRACKLDAWLLGHIHVPYPTRAQAEHPHFFFSATPTPDGFNRDMPGYCWLLEFESKTRMKMEQVETGRIRFHEWELELKGPDDIASLEARIGALPADSSLLKLRLSGRLAEEEIEAVQELRMRYQKELLYLEADLALAPAITAEYMNKKYASGTALHTFLQAVMAEPDADALLVHMPDFLT